MRPRRNSSQDLEPAHRRYLETGEYDRADTDANFWFWLHMREDRGADRGIRATWQSVREMFLAEWIARHPGTRPWAWWAFEAPRESVTARTGVYQAATRLRLRGIGTPAHEVLNTWADFAFGVPTYWVAEFDEEYRDGHFAGRAPDPHDPPCFESQATFLRRHGLLTPDEASRLTDRDFEPELLTVHDERN